MITRNLLTSNQSQFKNPSKDDDTIEFEIPESQSPETEQIFRVLYLHSKTVDGGRKGFLGEDCIDKLPTADETNMWDLGANLQLAAVDESVVSRFHENG